MSRTRRLHQKTSSCQCCPASTTEEGARRAATFLPFCPCPTSHPLGGLVTLSASSRLDRMATEPPGHGGCLTRFTTCLDAFTALACPASALAHDLATTARTQCATTQRSPCCDYHLWAFTRVCSDPRFAGRLSSLHALEEAGPRPGFSRRAGLSARFRPCVSDRLCFLPDKIEDSFLFSFFLPLFLSSQRQVKGTCSSYLCLLAYFSLRIPWDGRYQIA